MVIILHGVNLIPVFFPARQTLSRGRLFLFHYFYFRTPLAIKGKLYVLSGTVGARPKQTHYSASVGTIEMGNMTAASSWNLNPTEREIISVRVSDVISRHAKRRIKNPHIFTRELQ